MDITQIDRHFLNTFEFVPNYRNLRREGIDDDTGAEIDRIQCELEQGIQQLINAEIERQSIKNGGHDVAGFYKD